MRYELSKNKGFTLNELMLVVFLGAAALTGALYSYGVVKRTSEAIGLVTSVLSIANEIESQSKNNIKFDFDPTLVARSQYWPKEFVFNSAKSNALSSDGILLEIGLLSLTHMTHFPNINHFRQGYYIELQIPEHFSCNEFLQQVYPQFDGIIRGTALLKPVLDPPKINCSPTRGNRPTVTTLTLINF